MFVLDASVALSWQFERANAAERARADACLERLATESAGVPALWHVEVANGCIVAERRRLLGAADTDRFLAHLSDLPIETQSGPAGALRTLRVARDLGLTAYDAAYLELAQRLGVPLATFDRALAKAAARLGVGTL